MATTKPKASSMSKATQATIRRSVDAGRASGDVTTVTEWYRLDRFASEAEAKGAFELAYQQGMDGMGASPEGWMGLTTAEFDAWMRKGALPKRSR